MSFLMINFLLLAKASEIILITVFQNCSTQQQSVLHLVPSYQGAQIAHMTIFILIGLRVTWYSSVKLLLTRRLKRSI